MHKFVIEFETTKEIEGLTDLIAGRVYTLDGVDVGKDVKVTDYTLAQANMEGALYRQVGEAVEQAIGRVFETEGT